MVDEFTCHAGRALAVAEQKRKDAAPEGEPHLAPGHHLYVRPHDPQRDGPLPEPKPDPKTRRTRANQVRPRPAPG